MLGAADGISLNGDHNITRNCWVHNNWAMGISSHSRKGNVIESNLIEYNGQHPHLHHGVYADGDDLVARNNIIRNNAGFGLHLYPSMQKALVVNNLIYGHHYQSGIILYSPAGDEGGKNLIVNNTVVDTSFHLFTYMSQLHYVLSGSMMSGKCFGRNSELLKCLPEF